GVPHPARGGLYLHHGEALGQADEVVDAVGGLADGYPLRRVALGVYHGVGAAAQEELGLQVPVGLAVDLLGPQLLELVGYLQAGLEAVVDADEAGVKAGYVEGAQGLYVRAVAYLGR